MQIPDFRPMDEVVLQPWDGGGCWAHTLLCAGAALFGHLRPGAYRLTLRRGTRRVFLLLRLPPGANILLRYTWESGGCGWRRDPFHYFYNARWQYQAGGAEMR